PVAVVVVVALVELLEVIEAGVADGEPLAILHAAPDLALDLRRAGKPGGRVDGDVACGPGHQAVQAARLRRQLDQPADDVVRPRGKPFLNPIGRVPTGEDGEGYDRRIGVRLEPAAQGEPLRAVVGVDDDQLRQGSQHPLLHVTRVRHGDDGESFAVHPVRQEVRYRATSRREKEYRRAPPAHLAPRVRVERAYTYA